MSFLTVTPEKAQRYAAATGYSSAKSMNADVFVRRYIFIAALFGFFEENGGSLEKAVLDDYVASMDVKTLQELKEALSGNDSGVCTQDDFFKALTTYYASH